MTDKELNVKEFMEELKADLEASNRRLDIARNRSKPGYKTKHKPSKTLTKQERQLQRLQKQQAEIEAKEKQRKKELKRLQKEKEALQAIKEKKESMEILRSLKEEVAALRKEVEELNDDGSFKVDATEYFREEERQGIYHGDILDFIKEHPDKCTNAHYIVGIAHCVADIFFDDFFD